MSVPEAHLLFSTARGTHVFFPRARPGRRAFPCALGFNLPQSIKTYSQLILVEDCRAQAVSEPHQHMGMRADKTQPT